MGAAQGTSCFQEYFAVATFLLSKICRYTSSGYGPMLFGNRLCGPTCQVVWWGGRQKKKPALARLEIFYLHSKTFFANKFPNSFILRFVPPSINWSK